MIYFTEGMFCKFCRYPLHLSNIQHEVRHGLGSLLDIQCQMCMKITAVSTGKRHTNCTFDVNSKAAIGMCMYIKPVKCKITKNDCFKLKAPYDFHVM